MDSKKFLLFKNNKLFLNIDLKQKDIEHIKGDLVSVEEGTIIIKNNEPSNRLFFIAGGEIKLILKNGEHTVIEATRVTNDYFGLFDKTGHEMVSAVAENDSYLVEFTEEETEALLQLNSAADEILSEQLADLNSVKEDLEESVAVEDYNLPDESVTEDEEVEPEAFNEDDYTEFSTESVNESDSAEADEDATEEFTEDDTVVFNDNIPEDILNKQEPVPFVADLEEEIIPAEEEIDFTSDYETEEFANQSEPDKTANISHNKLSEFNGYVVSLVKAKSVTDLCDKTAEALDILTKALQVNVFRYSTERKLFYSACEDNRFDTELTFGYDDDLTGLDIEDELSITPDRTKVLYRVDIENCNNPFLLYISLDENSETPNEFLPLLKELAVVFAELMAKLNSQENLLVNQRINSLKKISGFLANDIKKPVLVSKRYAEHLRQGYIPENVEKALKMMVEQLNGVSDLIKTISDFAKGKPVMRFSNIHLNRLLNEFLSSLDDRFTEYNCDIVKNYDKDCKVNLDRGKFFLVISNVIKNAYEAMPNGGNINISTIVLSKSVEIRVRDYGEGIPGEILDNIFEPFISTGDQNAGLGLFLSKIIIDEHKGSITISNMEKGAEVIITLPLAKDLL